MSASTNRRRPSPDAADTTGHSYQLILEHILTYPGSYTLGQPPTMPLRSNSTRSRPKLTQQWSSSSRPVTPTLNPRRPAFSPPPDTGTPSPDVAAAAAFTTTLLNHIGNSPSQPCSLPPIFTASFLRNCFPSELHLVGFPQALEGLEYLEDLNRRRRREVAGAKRRIGLRDGAAIDAAEGSKSSDAVKAWVRDVENSERKAEALFTQLFVALRRWILINELSLTPFNKHNALAMLNTLYSPSRCTSGNTTTTISNPQIPITTTTTTTQPSTTLTPSVLSNQRTAFLTYITAVESRGPAVLKPLMNQGMRPSDSEWETGWPAVAATMNVYLRICLKTVEDATAVRGREDIELPVCSAGGGSAEKEKEKSKGKRKIDSAISGAHKSPIAPNTPTMQATGREGEKTAESKPASAIWAATRTSAQSTTSSTSTPGDKNKPLPPSPPHVVPPAATTPASAPATTSQATTSGAGPAKTLSRLEKIALEVRRIRAKREEQYHLPPQHVDLTSSAEDKENAPTVSARVHRSGQVSLDDRDMMMSGALAFKAAQSPAATQTQPQASDEDRGRATSAMKRLRSLGDMKFGSNARSGKSRSRSRAAANNDLLVGNSGASEAFDEQEMKRQRALFEARAGGDGST